MSDSEVERRPRPIGVADESEEDSDVDRNEAPGDAQLGGSEVADTASAAMPKTAPEDETKKRVSTRRRPFSENDLLKEKGLIKIYKDFPKKCQYKGKGREAEFLRGLMVSYKEWGYQLYPGVAFEDLASRTEKLGGKIRIRNAVQELRDEERDRDIEAKFGRSAVDDVHAQEAAKVIAKDTAAAEEREDEELANSRYMDVDGEGAPASTMRKGWGDAEDGRTAATSSGGVSEEVRERMEVNRRLALERLRSKKEEAAAAQREMEEGLEEANRTSAAGLPVDDRSGLVDAMDVDAVEEGPDDDFEDDEAALAEMEAEAIASTSKLAVGASTQQAATNLPPSPAAAAAAAVVPRAVSDNSFAESDAITGTAVETSPVSDTVDSMAVESTKRENEATESVVSGASRTATDHSGPASVLDTQTTKEPPDMVAVRPEHASDAATVTGSATLPTDFRGSESCPDPGALPKGSSTEQEDGCAEKLGDSSPPPSEAEATAVTVDAAAGSIAEAAAAKGGSFDEQVSLGSPGKSRSTGGVPLSPLGKMFVGTDVSAEGGSAEARPPLRGLFSDDNL